MPSSILFVLLGSLGDVCRSLPVLCLLRERWPGARISWAVDERWASLAAQHPAADRLVVFPRPRTARGLAAFARALRAEPYDLALDLQRILKSGLCSRLSRAPRRLGFNPADAKEFNHLFATEWIRPVSPDTSKLVHYLAFAEHLGIAVPKALPFGLGHLSDRRRLPAPVQELVERGYVAVVAGSSWRSKDWSPAGYRALLAHIAKDSRLGIVLVGDASQRDVIAGLDVGRRVVNLVGSTSLVELAAVLGCARAAAGPDTGAGHLAAALGTPYVALLGPTRPSRVAPHGYEHLVVTGSVVCDGCGRRCRRRAGRCMDAIAADAVWSKLRAAAESRESGPKAG